MLHGLDPNYFSAREAAYMSHYRFRGLTNRRMDDHFAKLGILPTVPPRGETSGFAFTNVKLGTKEVRVRLLGDQRLEDFHFYVTVPGFRADHHEVDWEAFTTETEFIEIESDAELFEVLEALPCCTTRKNGTGKGDPLNLIVIGPEGALRAFVRAGWDETELLTWGSGWRTFKAFFGGTYKYSPMSALYYDGRPQDIGLQKARDTIHERNHLRLWLTPYKYQENYVLVGTITRDIGVYFTTRAWNLTTHAIDPEVDEARNYLVEDLLTTEAIRTFGTVVGVGATIKDDPHRNLMFAPWWTDGRRAVLLLGSADERVPIERIDYFQGYQPGQIARNIKGRKLEGGSLAELQAEHDEEERKAAGTEAAPANRPLSDHPLADTRWTLATLQGDKPLADATVTIGFTAASNVDGTDGCNRYQGRYGVEGTSLRFPDEFTATMMVCPEPIMNQAQAYMRALKRAASYAIDAGQLTLRDDLGDEFATFAAQDDRLAGTFWKVTAYNNGRQAVVSVIIGSEITAAFGEDGKVTGKAGCNSYFAAYERKGETIAIGSAGTTRRACAEPEGIMEQERLYLEALQSAAILRIDADRMELRAADGSLAVTLARDETLAED
jgi:heat shock protein HslJ